MAKKTPQECFARVLRDARRQLGLSQEAFAEIADIHRTYVSQLERGLKTPSLDVLLKIGKGLGVKASSLVAAVEQALHRS